MKITFLLGILVLIGGILFLSYSYTKPITKDENSIHKRSQQGVTNDTPKPNLFSKITTQDNRVNKAKPSKNDSGNQYTLITVSGNVIDDKGNPVDNVSLLTNAEITEDIKTDLNGNYRFQFPKATIGINGIKIRFIKHGYVYQSKHIDNIKVDKKSAYKIDVVLDRISGYAVSGYILDDTNNNGVAGIRLSLYSKEKQRATRVVSSNEQGHFSIPYVPPANDYTVRVINTPSFIVEPFNLPNNITVSNAPVNLTLLATRIEGDVGDLNLNLRDAFSLPLESLNVSINQGGKMLSQGITDANGIVSFENAPDGKLNIQIDSLGMRITNLERKKHDNVTITADLGYNDLVVNVIGEDDSPVVCQQASLFYSYSKDGYTVRSTTPLAYDETGAIRHSGLGDGSRKLLLSECLKHRGASVSLELGTIEETVRLSPD